MYVCIYVCMYICAYNKYVCIYLDHEGLSDLQYGPWLRCLPLYPGGAAGPGDGLPKQHSGGRSDHSTNEDKDTMTSEYTI